MNTHVARLTMAALLMSAIVLAAPAHLLAATYYVDAADAAARDGSAGTEAAPCKTIQHAADKEIGRAHV